MAVTTTPYTEYAGNELIKLFFKDALQKQLARELCVSQAEGIIEMMCDGYDDEVKTHADTVRAVAFIKDSAKDLIADYMHDLQASLEKYVDELSVKCVNSTFNDEGLVDIGIFIEYPAKGE